MGDIVPVMLVHALLFLPNIASAFQSQCHHKKHVQKGAIAKQKSYQSSLTLSTQSHV